MTICFLRCSVVFAFNILIVLIAQKTILRRHYKYTKMLWIASCIHACFPYGILNLNIGQDAIRRYRDDFIFAKIRTSTLLWAVVILGILIMVMIERYATSKNNEVFFISHYDNDKDIYVSCKEGPAFVSGIFKYRIAMPKVLDGERYILEHERQHIHNHDNQIRFLYSIWMKLFWFNPLVYLGNNKLSDAIEMHCDEEVTEKYSKAEKVAYMRCMANQADMQRRTMDRYCKKTNIYSFFASKKSQLYRRVKRLTEGHKRTFIGEIGCRFATIMLLFVMFSVGAYQGQARKYYQVTDDAVSDADIVVLQDNSDSDLIVYVNIDDAVGEQVIYSSIDYEFPIFWYSIVEEEKY